MTKLPLLLLLVLIGFSYGAGYSQKTVLGVQSTVTPAPPANNTPSCSGVCTLEYVEQSNTTAANQTFWFRVSKGNDTTNIGVNSLLVEILNSTDTSYNVSVYATYYDDVLLFKKWIYIQNASSVRSPDNVTYLLFNFNPTEVKKMKASQYLVVNTTLRNATVAIFLGDQAEQELANKMAAVGGLIVVGGLAGALLGKKVL